jgi:hypothetical protein
MNGPAQLRHSPAVYCFAFLSYFLLLPGCSSTTDFKFPHDPGGGLLTSSEACLYDFDADGFWYVIFLRCDQLGIANHRHEAGHHLMLRSGDLLFYSRCSGRGEAIDIMGKTFALKNGLVFLVATSPAETRVTQLPAQARRFNGADSRARAAALEALTMVPSVERFLSADAQARILENERSQQQTSPRSAPQ